MATWSIPRCFEGCTVAVLASGPSMSQAVADKIHAANVPAIAINTTFRLAPWAWAIYAADADWWLHPKNRDALREFGGLKISIHGPETDRISGLRLLRRSSLDKMPDAQDAILTLSHSGAQALQIAAKTGARRVLLCGYDMRVTPDACHWHGAHPPQLKKTDPDNYPGWIRKIASIAPTLAKRGVEVLNCTPDSALQCFPMVTLEDALARVESTQAVAALSA